MDSLTQNLCCVLLASALLAGCSQQVANEQSETAKNPTTLVSLSETQKKQRDHAVSAKEKLFKSLLGELTASIGKNGVADSIEICKTRAPQLARTVSDEFGLRIGRTSFLLRNAENQPPPWAATFVKDRVETEVNVDIGEDRLGVLLPIRLKEACIKCHGASETITAEVASKINDHYPTDAAMGFAEGDLRGYFWIEVPAGQLSFESE